MKRDWFMMFISPESIRLGGVIHQQSNGENLESSTGQESMKSIRISNGIERAHHLRIT